VSKILLVEDDLELSAMIGQCLEFDNHNVESVSDGREALRHLQSYEYDLVILDWALPALSGVEICKQFRAEGGTTPVLMLTGKAHVSDKEIGFDSGADDYLTKPVDLRELNARVKAHIRRAASQFAADILSIGDLTLNASNYRVTRGGREIKLIPKEFALLELMMRHPGKVFSASTLLNRIWNTGDNFSSQTIRTHIKNLRKKLAVTNGPQMIHTVHAVGYKVEL
jgi:DNA-binding response OmpR family regulator